MKYLLKPEKNIFKLFDLFLIFIVLVPISQGETTSYANYEVNVTKSLISLHVKVCFDKSIPKYLHATNDGATQRLQYVRINGDKNRSIKVRANRISLRELESGDCLQYEANIESSPEQRRRAFIRGWNLAEDNIRISPANWLWLPRQHEIDGNITITFAHPDDYSVSAPWKLVKRSNEETTYRLGETPQQWNAYTVLGNFHMEEVSVPGSVIRLAVMKGEPEANYADVYKWIEHGAESISLAYGQFPIPSPQIVVVPSGESRGGAVPFGHILRGGGTASLLYIDQTRPISQHIKDWTLTHELSHMLHPYMGNAGSWMAEGLASYYQNVLQARAGSITHQRAWQKLHEGFQRGIRQTYNGVTLEDASTNRGRSGRMRVYWSGAAISLLADLELRRRGDSLDNVLSRFRICCLPAEELWEPFEFMRKMDELSNSTIFTNLHRRYVLSDIFPEIDHAYDELGIYIADGTVTFRKDEQSKRLRKSIMSPVATTKQAWFIDRNLR